MAAVPSEGHAAAVPSRFAPEGEATRLLYERHQRKILSFCKHQLGSREEAEDAVQDALVKAWKSRWRVRDPEKFPAWLAIIARHRARDVFRRRRPLLEKDLEGHALSCPTSPGEDTTALDRQLHSALAALPELHRSALTLRYFEEMDYRSIENLLGLSSGSLRGILGRALVAMRKQLKPALASLE